MFLLAACNAPLRGRTTPEVGAQPLRFEVPASLEHERSMYEKDVAMALGEVSAFFLSSGFRLPDPKIIDSVMIFESSSKAREYLAKAYAAPAESIPETFSGTVEGAKLFLVSRGTYQDIWQELYPEWPWAEQNYHQLILHELAHRAHEQVAIAWYGSAEAMGPTWFFEGLAVTCAGQFETDKPPLTLEELHEQVGSGHTPMVSYPLYGRIVRSLGAKYGMKVLIARASEPGFPEVLWSPEITKEPQGNESAGKGIKTNAAVAQYSAADFRALHMDRGAVGEPGHEDT
ncbi:MAG: hypothetical protein AB1714_24090 [Acidobacteriota bacterium]